ncbi:hypothetical protein LTR91_020634 [Friedmanniomyces endolithicus]|uniref:Uncharacterized protein n=1 Tax=Friedmanniomyces endolithicus TaxID=329885 RepID=A0AAN6K4T7_9PEZI|nr:hypothetical protein LTR94_018912 [Friedmanniomyces endolithicus]KAK0772757.1 hypothetical protein LTR59_015557 [Friedmanniomyces endolithicus]KAK0776626.1 hypothetical protein LTR38_015446 [Friedmanniomyces endolithicus]KAK0779912.1 hypothetical protein LTR75_015202 [Friedmanniomyces endolithicus]KAK0832561.1 hypothetical protein LTR03_015116 [Friedmanniomyces endolithicus]
MTTAAEPKYILSAGLGRFASQDANAAKHFGPQASEKTRELLAISIAQAREAGFEVIGEDVNPSDPDDTIKRFSAQLESRQWVAVNVGYGIRGHKDHTELFERILEACRTIRPGAKIIFSNGPDEVFAAIKRNFPESFWI